jgi:hypothetical protein
MKTYRHKQTGDIAELSHTHSQYYMVGLESFHKRFIENSNDWELVEITDYSVISYLDKSGNKYTIEKEGVYKCERFPKGSFISVGKSFKMKDVIIQSIKRLSDGEVFSVGDYIYEDSKITEIILDKKGYTCPWLQCNDKVGSSLRSAEKRKALFTTEDGVDIKEGDKCFMVYLPLSNHSQLTGSSVFTIKFLPNPSYRLIFSNEKAAKEYIAYNKPRFSLDEIKNIRTEIGSFGGTLINKLEQIIKSEL